jgi:hypothetical protein
MDRHYLFNSNAALGICLFHPMRGNKSLRSLSSEALSKPLMVERLWHLP